MRFFDRTADRADRAVARAERAAFALIRHDLITKQFLADARRTSFVANVRFIFVTEIMQRGKNRVRCRLTESAQRVLFDVVAQLFHLVEVFHRCGAVGDFAQHLVQALGADAACRTFTAALIDCEFEEEFRDVDHAVVFVHDDQAARTHHRADGDQVVIIDGRIDEVRRNASARRAACLRRFEFFAVGAAAADVIDDLAHRGAHRDLDKPGVVDLAAERKHFRAAALFGTHGSEPIGAFENDLRNVRIRFNVVQDGRLSEQALDRRERRTGTRLAAVPFDGCHESRLFAADKRARAETDIEIEIKARIKDIFAEQAVFTRLFDRDSQALHRDRVFRTHIDVTLIGTDRICRDRHCLDDRMRIAFENGAVHERAGVALVGVAADVFLFADGILCKLPFPARREARAAAAAKPGFGDHIDDVLRRHFREYFAERFVTVIRDVFLDLFGVDHAAVAQRHAVLLFIEIGVVERLDAAVFGNRFLIKKAGHDAPFDDVLIDDFIDVFHFYLRIERAFGIDDHDRAKCTEPEAARFGYVHFIFKPFFADTLDKCIVNFHRIAGSTARTAADKNV